MSVPYMAAQIGMEAAKAALQQRGEERGHGYNPGPDDDDYYLCGNPGGDCVNYYFSFWLPWVVFVAIILIFVFGFKAVALTWSWAQCAIALLVASLVGFAFATLLWLVILT